MNRYAIVSERSRISIEVESTLKRLELVSAELSGEFEAEVRDGHIAPECVQASFSVPTASLVSGNWLFDRDVRFTLEARKYPQIAGKLLEVKTADGNGNYWVRGNLRLRGVGREVQGLASVSEVSDRHIVLEGSMTVDFTHFNLAVPRLLMLRVEPEVQIHGRVWAERTS